MKRYSIPHQLRQRLRQALQTTDGRIRLGGLCVGLWYFPVWAGTLLRQFLEGSPDAMLVPLIAILGFYRLWQRRHSLAELQASAEDRLLGNMLIIGCALIYPFCLFDTWSQALVWALVLVGIACSIWGLPVLRRYWLENLLLVVSTYPNLGFGARTVWRGLTPPYLLENLMAWLGTGALRAMGQPATAIDRFVTLPAGSVEVASGCSGLDMSITLSVTGILLGIFFKQSWRKTWTLVLVGVLIALVFNVPRIVLLTFASVYWGKSSFEFWHGSIGGQIFSAIMLTVYYYVAMAIINARPARKA